MNANASSKVRTTCMQVWWMLKLTYGLLFVIAGADKFMNLVVMWEKYLSHYILTLVPISAPNFMYIVGVLEIVIGLLILINVTRLGAYLAASWFFIIVLNLLSMRDYFDIAVRDIVLAIGAIALARLTDIKNEI